MNELNELNQQAPKLRRTDSGEVGITYDEVVEDSFPASDPPPYTCDAGAMWADQRAGQHRAFFDTYAAALSASDSHTIAAAYADPFMATGPGFRTCNRNDDQFLARLDRAAEFYHAIGVRSIKINAYAESALDLDFTLIKIEWTLSGEDGCALVAFDTTYLVQTMGSDPKIILFYAHNEQQRLRERGLDEIERGAYKPDKIVRNLQCDSLRPP